MYGNIFLIIALLVIVFGQSIGGGLVDAYTAKKVLPRLLIAAILINTSIYIVVLLVDLTNIIGTGINTLITQPFANAGDFKLQLNGAASALGIAGIVGASFAAFIGSAVLLQFLWVFILLPAFLAFIGVLATVIIRRGLIIFLIIISPVAFALYCLPNTEQYFKKWWELLFKTLLVYPIIAAVFAIANVMSKTINLAGQTSGVTATIAGILSVVALVIPLFLIPFAFKLAGGLIGSLTNVLANAGKRGHEAYKGNVNDGNSRQNRTRRRLADRNVRSRERGVEGISSWQKSNSGFKRRVGRSLNSVGRLLNSGDLEAKRSALTKQEAELRELKTNYGPDSSVRALTQ